MFAFFAPSDRVCVQLQGSVTGVFTARGQGGAVGTRKREGPDFLAVFVNFTPHYPCVNQICRLLGQQSEFARRKFPLNSHAHTCTQFCAVFGLVVFTADALKVANRERESLGVKD